MTGTHHSRSRPLVSVSRALAGVVVVVAAVGAVAGWQALSHGPKASAGAVQRAAKFRPGVSGTPAAARVLTPNTAPPPPLAVTSVNPANGATSASGTGPVSVTFSSPPAPSSALPVLSPAVGGTWARSGSGLVFTPLGGFSPGATETLTVPAGLRAGDGAILATPVTARFAIEGGSVLRLQQLLSELDYSPLAFTPASPLAPTDAAAQGKAAFDPPAGTFAWRNQGWPTQLTSQWQPGVYNVLTRGLVMSFEADHGLTPDGIAGPQVWASLLSALASGDVNTGGYSYAYASKGAPESLTIWHNGAQVFTSLANTGIPQAPTASGTFPVYERLRTQTMQGTNPDGSKYADPVQFVAYFNGGDAVHYINRASFGYPQSLGCVELPLAAAAQAWPLLAYGTLVTVAG